MELFNNRAKELFQSSDIVNAAYEVKAYSIALKDNKLHLFLTWLICPEIFNSNLNTCNKYLLVIIIIKVKSKS